MAVFLFSQPKSWSALKKLNFATQKCVINSAISCVIFALKIFSISQRARENTYNSVLELAPLFDDARFFKCELKPHYNTSHFKYRQKRYYKSCFKFILVNMVRPGMLYMLYDGGKIELSDSTYQKMDEDFLEVITCAQKFIKLIWLTVINTKKSFVMKYNEIPFAEFSESIKKRKIYTFFNSLEFGWNFQTTKNPKTL